MDNGRIAERGTYDELMTANSTFARLARVFGTGDTSVQESESQEEEKKAEAERENDRAESKGAGKEKAVSNRALMQKEERVVGRVRKSTYLDFLRAANGAVTAPLLLTTMVLMCAALSE